VFNPTKREERAMKKPEVIERMQKDGISPLVASMKVLSEAKAERKAYELYDTMPDDMCRLFTADIRNGLNEIQDESIDFIITDPPYPREYISLYGDLSCLASRVLKQGGSLIVMIGQSYLPEIIEQLNLHMSYYWIMPYLTPGGGAPLLYQKRVNTFWKPVLWFVKGEYKGDYVGDVLRSPESDKRFHEWGQSLGGMSDIIERFTNPNDLILDPFLGGGTTGAAAISMGRKFIGSDIESSNVEISLERIKEAYINACNARKNRLEG
jgi:site-specific DNA-methyltransferase (adenine-specific)